MELQSISELERATRISRQELFRMGMALLFVVGIPWYQRVSIAWRLLITGDARNEATIKINAPTGVSL